MTGDTATRTLDGATRTVFAVLAFGTLAALAAAVAWMALARGDAGFRAAIGLLRNAALALLLLGTVTWFLRRIAGSEADAFAPTTGFVALYLAWFAIGSMDLVAADPMTVLWDRVPLEIWYYVAVGLLAYLVGTWTLPPYHAAQRWVSPDGWRPSVQRWNHRLAMLVLMALFMLLSCSWAYQIRSAGGIPLLGENVAQARVAAAEGGVVFSVFVSAVDAYVPLALLYAWSRDDIRPGLRRVLVASCAVCILLAISFGSRGLALVPALEWLLMHHYARRRLGFRHLVTMATAAILVLSFLGIQRDLRHYGPSHLLKFVDWGFPLWSLPFTYIYTYVRDSVVTFGRLTTLIPRLIPFQDGAIFLAPFATVLPGHQDTSDLIFKRMLRSEFLGFGQPATLLGSLYADFGAVAVAAGLFLFGLVCRLVHRSLSLRPTPYTLLLHVWLVQIALLSLFSSLFTYITTVFVPMLLYVLVSSMALGSRRPAAERAA